MEFAMQDIKDPDCKKFQNAIHEHFDTYVNAPTYRGGYYTFFQLNQLIELTSRIGFTFSDRSVIDFGCGATRPVTASILMYLLGARSCMALDLEEPFDFGGIAVAEYCNILAVISDKAPLNYHGAGRELRELQLRAADFDMASLLRGDLQKGLAPNIRHRLCRFQDIPPEERAFDLMISNSVFEHVNDIDAVLKLARSSISEDGFIYTSIDFRDHRLYAASLSPWQFLVDDDDYSPGYINKIRFTEMCQIIRDASFEIVECSVKREQPPHEILENILPKYEMSEVDLETVEAQLLLKPK